MYNSLALILGHMAGDYLFQSDKMALNKSGDYLNNLSKRTGITGFTNSGWCTLHCVIYAICVATFVIIDGWRCSYDNLSTAALSWLMVYTVAYATHYPIDRYSFGWTWMKWFGQTKFSDTYYIDDDDSIPVITSLRALFVPLVYVAIDNTLHLILMWVALSVLGR